jgi:hypothetical protein
MYTVYPLDFFGDHLICKPCGVGDYVVSVIPSRVIPQVILQEGVHIAQFLIPQIVLLQHPLSKKKKKKEKKKEKKEKQTYTKNTYWISEFMHSKRVKKIVTPFIL